MAGAAGPWNIPIYGIMTIGYTRIWQCDHLIYLDRGIQAHRALIGGGMHNCHVYAYQWLELQVLYRNHHKNLPLWSCPVPHVVLSSNRHECSHRLLPITDPTCIWHASDTQLTHIWHVLIGCYKLQTRHLSNKGPWWGMIGSYDHIWV